MQTNLKAFVASTYEDLQPHRERVIGVLRESGLNVVSMEEWPADPQEPKQFCPDRVEDCDLLVLLIARRRGYIPTGETESITQREYRYAMQLGVDVLAFCLDDQAEWEPEWDERERDPLFRAWREQVLEKHGVKHFGANPEDLERALRDSVHHWVLRTTSRREALTFACRKQMESAIGRLSGPDGYRPETYIRRDIDSFLRHFLASDEHWLFPLIGPPGCGKTSAICQLATSLLQRGQPGLLLDTSEFHRRGRTGSGLDALAIATLNAYMPEGAQPFDPSSGLAQIHRLVRGFMPGLHFVIIIEGLDETRFVSQVHPRLPVDPDSVAGFIRQHADREQLKFVITCRESPWRDAYEGSAPMQPIESELPARSRDEPQIKDIGGADTPGALRGPQTCQMALLNDVELSLALAKYQQYHGVRVHLADRAWEDARDPFMLGAAFEYWANILAKPTGSHFAHVAGQIVSPAAGLPPWSVDSLRYFDQLEQFWQRRQAHILDLVRSFDADRGWTRSMGERAMKSILARMVTVMLEEGVPGVPYEECLPRDPRLRELADHLLRRMGESGLLATVENHDDSELDLVSFATTRHREYQLGREILRRMDDPRESLGRLLDHVQTHHEWLEQPFVLALHELCRRPGAAALQRQEVFSELLRRPDALAFLESILSVIPVLPAEEASSLKDQRLWTITSHAWDFSHAAGVLDSPRTLRGLGREIEQLEVALGELQSDEGRPQPARDVSNAIGKVQNEYDPNWRADDVPAAFGEIRLALRDLGSPLEELASRLAVASSSSESGTQVEDRRQPKRVLHLCAAYHAAASNEAREALDRLAAGVSKLETAQRGSADTIRALTRSSQDAPHTKYRHGAALGRAASKRETLAASPPDGVLQTLWRTHEELCAQIDSIVAASRAGLPELPPDAPPGDWIRSLPGARLADVDWLTDFAGDLLARSEPEVLELGQELSRLLRAWAIDKADNIAQRLHKAAGGRYRQEDYAGAQRLYAAAVEFQRGEGATWFNLGLTFFRLGRLKSSLEALAQARQLMVADKDLLDVYYVTGWAQEKLFDKQGALESYREALSMGLDDDRVQRRLESLTGRTVDEEPHRAEGSESEPEPDATDTHLREARQLLRNNEYVQAEGSFQMALQRARERGRELEAKVFWEWAYCLLSTRLAAEAIQAHLAARDHALAHSADRDTICSLWNNLGCLQADAEQAEQAEFQYLAALAANPSARIPQSNLAYHLISDQKPARPADPDAAEREAEQLQLLDEDSADAKIVQARVRKARGGKGWEQEYTGLLERALESQSHAAVTAAHELMRYHLGRGKRTPATAVARRVLHEFLPAAEESAIANFMPSSLCEWYFQVADCASVMGDCRGAQTWVTKMEEIILGHGSGEHVPADIRLEDPITEERISTEEFLARSRRLLKRPSVG